MTDIRVLIDHYPEDASAAARVTIRIESDRPDPIVENQTQAFVQTVSVERTVPYTKTEYKQLDAAYNMAIALREAADKAALAIRQTLRSAIDNAS